MLAERHPLPSTLILTGRGKHAQTGKIEKGERENSMKKKIAIVLASAALMFAAPASQKFTGVITDDMCAKGDHKDMHMGTDPKCVEECIKGMKGKYMLYDGKDSWTLSDQKMPAKFAAKKVTVTGTMDEKTKTITVEKIEAAK
jgi:hypothetical protein